MRQQKLLTHYLMFGFPSARQGVDGQCLACKPKTRLKHHRAVLKSELWWWKRITILGLKTVNTLAQEVKLTVTVILRELLSNRLIESWSITWVREGDLGSWDPIEYSSTEYMLAYANMHENWDQPPTGGQVNNKPLIGQRTHHRKSDMTANVFFVVVVVVDVVFIIKKLIKYSQKTFHIRFITRTTHRDSRLDYKRSVSATIAPESSFDQHSCRLPKQKKKSKQR